MYRRKKADAMRVFRHILHYIGTAALAGAFITGISSMAGNNFHPPLLPDFSETASINLYKIFRNYLDTIKLLFVGVPWICRVQN